MYLFSHFEISKTMAEALQLAILPFSVSVLLLLLLFSTSDCNAGVIEEKQSFLLERFQRKEQGPKTRCSSQKARTQNGASILELKHHDSWSGRTVHHDEKIRERLIFDEARVKSLQSRFKKSILGHTFEDKSETGIPISSGSKLGILNYIVTIELGNQKKTVILDTGSDLIWLQCEPCEDCYEQEDPLYNPSNSTFYRPILCNSSSCFSLQSATGNAGACISDRCNYDINYGDGSYSRGELGEDVLTLGQSDKFNGFIFGCGRSNSGLFGGAAGLIGLGRDPLSLISQTSSAYGEVFSYCLPDDDSSGSLILGREYGSAIKNSTEISFTPMISFPQLTNFYFLNLSGFSVGGVPIPAPNIIGTLIDSGTVITRIVPALYTAVRDEFRKQASGLGLPRAPGFSILDTCYNLTGFSEVQIPTLRMIFGGGAEIDVDASGIFYAARGDGSQVCLALASLSSDDDIGIIGNFQQKNQRIIYDNNASRLGFARETCSF